MRRWIWAVVCIPVLLQPWRCEAAVCDGLTVGQAVEVTDEGVTMLSKTSRWKRTGTVTALTVRSLPESVKVKRTLFTTDTLWCGFLRPVTPTPEPAPEPVPDPAPEPEPIPVPVPPSTTTIPLQPLNLPDGVAWPVSGGITLPRGLAIDCRQFSLPCVPLASWPDGTLKAVKLTTLAQAGEALFVTVAASSEPLPTGAVDAPAPSLPGRVSLLQQGQGLLLGPTTQPQLRHWSTSWPGWPAELHTLTLVDQRPEQVTAPKPFVAEAYTWEIPGQFTTYAIGGANGQVYTGAIPTDGASLYQGGEAVWEDGWYRGVTQWYDGVGTGTAAPGWACGVRADGHGTCVSVAGFADQFPIGLRVWPDRLVVEFHPVRATTGDGGARRSHYQRPTSFSFPREGGAKTYRIVLAHDVSVDAFQPFADAFQQRPRLAASREWLAGSGAFGLVGLSSPASAGYDRFLIDGILTPSTTKPSHLYLKGWRDVGDRLRGGYCGTLPDGTKVPCFYNDTHVGAHQFYLEWLRTGNPIWWTLGEQTTEHVMDLDVSHTTRTGYWQASGKWLTSPPGELHAIKHEIQDHTSRNVHPGHAHLSGLTDRYLLTGDPRTGEVLREMGDWWVTMQPVFFPVPPANPHGAEAERDYAWPLWCLNEAYRATGDRRYHEAAGRVVQHLVGWWQQDADHLVAGQVVGRNDADAGTGWFTMRPKCDNCPTGYNGTNPWMAGALLTALIDFYEHDSALSVSDRALVKTMILQALNYVVKYGYETSKQYRPYNYFVYSEAGREIDGGLNHLLYPLVWGAREIRRGVEHPEWYDTSAQWWPIAKAALDDWAVVKWRGSTSLGFYGYEFIRPEAWVLAEELRAP